MAARMNRPGGPPRQPGTPAGQKPALAKPTAEKPTREKPTRAKQPKPVRTRVAVDLPDETASGHWLRSIRLSGFTFVMLTILVLTIVVLAPGLRTLVEQQNQLAELRASVEEHKASVKDLEGDIARWDDPAYIEAQARDRLVYVFPGDYTYLIVDDGTTVTTEDGAPISASLQTTKVDWVRSLLASLVTAGTTTETAEQIEAPAP